ncbi:MULTISPECIES: hypothetical protein [unclassified Brevundimonas]|uniref:hypothetical protein n=1 Tax=unclassified Brevundimonas TaxID=2622653 RepID=UPI0025BDD810|nr:MULTISPECIES: hypothetical protein [unclassified Brevundimonas]
MSFSLSAPPPPISPSPRKQRAMLLMASAVAHIVVLVPIALNTVFIPSLDDDSSFEVWIDMERDRPRPERERLLPQDRPIPPENTEDTPREEPITEAERERLIEEIIAARPDVTVEQIEALLPQLAEQRPQEVERLDSAPTSSVADLNITALPNVSAPVTRPTIEAIDGPRANAAVAPLSSASLPSIQSADQAGQATEDEAGSPDAPIPRRARIDEDALGALDAAARGGALDDAWTYRPEAGGGGQSGQTGGQTGGQIDPLSGRGGVSGNTATRTGRIYYGQGTTPIDCTQPQMLSDVERLSCDSAEQRRIRASMERGVRVQGTGNAARDANLGAVGAHRMEEYESRRRTNGGVGVSQGSMLGGSGQGEILDEMSGTNREIRKIQEQIGASNGPKPPPPRPNQ